MKWLIIFYKAYNLTSLCAVSCGISSLHWYRSRVCKPLYNYRKIYLKPNWCPLNLPGLEKVIAIFHLYTRRRLTNHFPCSIFISNQPSLPCSPPIASQCFLSLLNKSMHVSKMPSGREALNMIVIQITELHLQKCNDLSMVKASPQQVQIPLKIHYAI